MSLDHPVQHGVGVTFAANGKEPKDPDRLGIAVVGCGYWGVNYVRLLHELPELTLAAVCEGRPDRRHELSRRFPGAVFTGELDETLASSDVDAVVVCTEASSHYDIVRRCLLAGKHVLVEKPITTRSRDAEDLITMARSKELILMVGHTFLHNDAIRTVKNYVASPDFGRIYYMHSRRTNLGPVRRDVNAIWDLAAHDVSIFNYLLDSTPEIISAVGEGVLGSSREDVAFITLIYPNKVIGHIHVSWVDPNKVRELVVVGSERRIVFDDLNTQEQVRVFEKGIAPVPPESPSYGEHQFLTREGDIVSPRIPVSEPLKNQLRHFYDCVVHGNRPLTSGEQGLEVVRVLEAVDHSSSELGAPVRIAGGSTWTTVTEPHASLSSTSLLNTRRSRTS